MRSRLQLAVTMIVGAVVGGFVVLPLGMVSGLPRIAALVGAVVGSEPPQHPPSADQFEG
jgi:outer membrane lipoprotein SlyB